MHGLTRRGSFQSIAHLCFLGVEGAMHVFYLRVQTTGPQARAPTLYLHSAACETDLGSRQTKFEAAKLNVDAHKAYGACPKHDTKK